ncbi:MAG: hypothetical protein J6R20_05070 [Clostridia bacterium]|nr:hypothetical protein [Clostridia bacterium]
MSANISFKDALKKGALIYNPVLVQLVGLCPVIAASTTFIQALSLSVTMFLELIVVCVIASAFFKNLPRWIRVPIYFIIGLALVCPILYAIETYSLNDISLGMKIYLPLTAVNSVVAVHCEQFSVKNSIKLAFYDAVASGIGISAIFLITGAVREILGKASFAGISLNLPITFKGMALPFGCLILLGFLAALLKSFTAKYYPQTEKEEEVKTVTEELPEPVNTVEETVQPKTAEPNAEYSAEDDLNEFLKSLGIELSDEEGDAK